MVDLRDVSLERYPIDDPERANVRRERVHPTDDDLATGARATREGADADPCELPLEQSIHPRQGLGEEFLAGDRRDGACTTTGGGTCVARDDYLVECTRLTLEGDFPD